LDKEKRAKENEERKEYLKGKLVFSSLGGDVRLEDTRQNAKRLCRETGISNKRYKKIQKKLKRMMREGKIEIQKPGVTSGD